MKGTDDKLLRFYVRTVLREALREGAATPSTASAAGLALFSEFQPDRDRRVWILWDPAAAEEVLSEIVSGWEQPLRDSLEGARKWSAAERKQHGLAPRAGAMLYQDWSNVLANSPSRVIRGYIAVTPNTDGRAWGAGEVTLSAAVDGYGPLMYDIAMGATGRLTSDRDEVSRSARRVWSRYLSSRPDVKHLPLDDIEDPRTPDPEDDAVLHDTLSGDDNPLNYAYEAGSVPATTALENRSAEELEALREKWGFEEKYLTLAATWFFGTAEG